MNRIAFILESNFIYWNSLILVLAGASAVCLFLGLYLRQSKNAYAAFLTPPIATALSLALARFIHWYCRTGSYASLEVAMKDITDGGFALVGVFIGCFITAVLLRLIRVHKNLPQMLDCMSIAGAGSIALGRLSSFFTNADRGQIVESVKNLPWVYPTANAVSGALEYRLATFLIQAMVAFALFLILGLFYQAGKKQVKDGDTTLVFLLVYGASQILLDSTRYDSIYFRSNGFVSVVQVLSAVALGFVIVWFSIRMVRAKGFKFWQIPMWLVIAGLIGGAGYMEYHVQRHGNEALFAYSVMGSCLAGVVLLTLVIRAIAVHNERKADQIIDQAVAEQVIEEVVTEQIPEASPVGCHIENNAE